MSATTGSPGGGAAASNIKITISAVDLASAKIQQLNKTIASLGPSAAGVGRGLGQANLPGRLNTASESMRGLTSSTMGAVRAFDALLGSAKFLVGASTLAGAIAMTRQWAEAGTELKNTATGLNMPINMLDRLRIANQLAGGSAEQATAGIQGLTRSISDAAYGRNGRLLSFFKGALGINVFDPVTGRARATENVIADLAKSLERFPDPRDKLKALQEVGAEGLFPLLMSLEKYNREMERAERTGGELTEEQARNAAKLNDSWVNFGKTVSGVFNQMESDISPFMSRMMDWGAGIIQHNKEAAVRWAELAAAAVAAFATLRAAGPAAWMLRVLGLLGPGEVLLAGGLAYTGLRIGQTQPQSADDPTNPGWWQGRNFGPLREAGPRDNSVIIEVDPETGERRRVRRFHRPAEPLIPYSPGSIKKTLDISEADWTAFRQGVANVEGNSYLARSPTGKYLGRYQMGPEERADAARRLFEKVPDPEQFLHDPPMQERYFEAYKASQHDWLMANSPAYRRLDPRQRLQILAAAQLGPGRARTYLETGGIFRDANNTPITNWIDSVIREQMKQNDLETWRRRKEEDERQRRANDPMRGVAPTGREEIQRSIFPFDFFHIPPAPSAVPGGGMSSPAPATPAQGHVQVDIHFRNAPEHMLAQASGHGAVNVAPPRVETALAGILT